MKKAGFLQLAFMIYGASCGGAFGAEAMVSSSGPGMALLSLVLVPFTFSLPIAFAVGELTAAFPVEGGNYRWSRAAWGDFWGVQAAWWSWSTGMMTNLVFLKLFNDYFTDLVWPYHPTITDRWMVAAALIWTVHVLNMRGIDMVGNASIALTVAVLLPFLVLTVLGFANWKANPLVPLYNPAAGGPVSALGASFGLSIFLYAGYDKLANVAEEVEDPQKNFPPALTLALLMACVSYVLPTLAAVAGLGNWSRWTDGYFPSAARKLGGIGFGRAMAVAGMCSNALLLNVTMLAISRIPLAVAQDDFLPGMLSRHHPRFHTPTVALLAGSLVATVLTRALDPDSVLTINSWLQMTTNVLIFANLWKLRRTHADTPRSFSFPGGKPGLVVGTAVICLLSLFAIGTSVWDKDGLAPDKLAMGLIGLVSGAAGYLCLLILKHRRWKDVDERYLSRG